MGSIMEDRQADLTLIKHCTLYGSLFDNDAIVVDEKTKNSWFYSHKIQLL